MILIAKIVRKSTLTGEINRKSLLTSNIIRKSLLTSQIEIELVSIPVLVPPIIIEDVAPTKIKIPYDLALDETSIPATSSYTLSSGRTVTLVEVSGLYVYLTTSSRYYYGDVETVAYTAPGTNMIKSTLGGEADSFTATAITNNTLTLAPIDFLLESTGTGLGVSTLRFSVSENITLTLGANATFYTDAAGTLGASQTWDIVSGADRTIYIKCTTGTATLTIPKNVITRWVVWTSGTNAARISGDISKLSVLTYLVMTGSATLTGSTPTGLTYLSFNGANINWTYTGALPTGLTSLLLQGALIAWTYSGAMPTGLTFLWLNGNSIAWTGLDVSGTGNISTFSLLNYRGAKMSSADMITLLTSMTNRVGSLPVTVTINDYLDYASPPAGVTSAVAALKATKGITTVNLGA